MTKKRSHLRRSFFYCVTLLQRANSTLNKFLIILEKRPISLIVSHIVFYLSPNKQKKTLGNLQYNVILYIQHCPCPGS